MHFAVHMSTGDEESRMAAALDRWASLAGFSPEKWSVVPGDGDLKGVDALLWDLDCGTLPPEPFKTGPRDSRLLILCSSSIENAIDSYLMHPSGFLKKPLTLGALRRVLDRFAKVWHDGMTRLEVLCAGLKRRVPVGDILWVESSQHGTLIHTRREGIQTREALRDLDARLPDSMFLRCHRSFLVNLYHIREVTGISVKLDDGSDVPVGRSTKESVLEAYRQVRRMWDEPV